MPEGPSIIILKEQVQAFAGKKILEVSGNTKLDVTGLAGKKADALLDQDIFAGVGNIIKNEVLFRIRIHPESQVGALPPRKLTELIKEARNYSFDFLKWKKAFELRKHWLAHAKSECPRDHIPFVKVKHLGKLKRRAFFCPKCQKLYIL